MDRTGTDVLVQTADAFARNRLLATFPTEARALLEPRTAVVDLALGTVINASGADVVRSVFRSVRR